MSLTMDFSSTLEAFASPLSIIVEDMTGGYDNEDSPGEWIWGEPIQRETPIRAIALALSVQTLFFYKEGNVSDGGIALLTQDELFFTNIHQPTIEQNKQSIITYQNLKFRVVGDGFIASWQSLIGNGNFHCYHCLRYIQ